MRKIKKVLAVAMIGIMAAGCLTACGGGNGGSGKGGTKDIQIRAVQQGMGVQWIENLIEGFEKKYPEYNVTYTSSASSDAVKATLGLEHEDTNDLYFINKTYDTSYLESLKDVLEYTADGESKTIAEKFQASYLAAEEYDGDYYTLTWGGGIEGFVYNKALFEEAGITQLPRTTDELILLCDTLNEADITPLGHFQSDGYYSHMNKVWFAQYEGMEYWNDFYQNPSQEKMTTKDGRYEVLKVQEKLNAPQNVLTGSNSDSHIAMQTKFLEGQCAMMLSGSWLSTEMSNVGKFDDFEMMKTPVISSIKAKLTTVKSDGELRKLITAIDNVTDGVETEDTYKDGENYKVEGKSISKADWEYVKTARNMMPGNHVGLAAVVPTYSNAKEGAKLFLKYMYSDEGYKIYTDTTHVTLPLSLDQGEIDTSSWNTFEKNQATLFAKAENTVSDLVLNKHRLFIDGGADPFVNYPFVGRMSSKSEQDRMNADEVWKYIVDTVNERYENTWMANIK